MENNKKTKKNKKEFPRWIPLFLYSNCFGEGDNSSHLGLRFRGEYYCITHSPGNGILIQKKYLKMREISNREEYFKRCLSTPQIIHKTSMSISEAFLVNGILGLSLNKHSK